MQQVDIEGSRARSYLYYRHSLPVRIMHWTNVVALPCKGSLALAAARLRRARPARKGQETPRGYGFSP